MDAEPALIEFRDFRHTYMAGTPKAVPAARGITLSIQAKESLAIIGPPRSGKSTLVNAAAGLIRLKPGQVFFRGHDLAGGEVDRAELRQELGILFQDAQAQVVEDVVGKDVAFGPTASGLSASETRRRVEESLNQVGLPYPEFRLRYVHALSGGQLRRVATAGVLAMQTPILILDEPSAGLDPRGRRELADLLRDLRVSQDLTLVICSTGLTDAALLCDRVVVLDQGRILLEGEVREILRDLERLSELDITLPEAAILAAELQSTFPGLPTNVLSVTELEQAILAHVRSRHD